MEAAEAGAVSNRADLSFPPRLLRREEAARYAGVGATKFDEMVRDGRMPRPFKIDGLTRWDIRKVDAALDNLVDAGADNPWDRVA